MKRLILLLILILFNESLTEETVHSILTKSSRKYKFINNLECTVSFKVKNIGETDTSYYSANAFFAKNENDKINKAKLILGNEVEIFAYDREMFYYMNKDFIDSSFKIKVNDIISNTPTAKYALLLSAYYAQPILYNKITLNDDKWSYIGLDSNSSDFIIKSISKEQEGGGVINQEIHFNKESFLVTKKLTVFEFFGQQQYQELSFSKFIINQTDTRDLSKLDNLKFYVDNVQDENIKSTIQLDFSKLKVFNINKLREYTLQDFNTKYKILFFSKSDCSDCKQSIEYINSNINKFNELDVSILGIYEPEANLDTLVELRDNLKIQYDLYISSGDVTNNFENKFIILDKENNILKEFGVFNKEEIDNYLLKLRNN